MRPRIQSIDGVHVALTNGGDDGYRFLVGSWTVRCEGLWMHFRDALSNRPGARAHGFTMIGSEYDIAVPKIRFKKALRYNGKCWLKNY